MTATPHFNYHRPLPFCVQSYDFDALDMALIRPSIYFIRGLTLEDAMRLYWSWCGLSLGFSVSGIHAETIVYGAAVFSVAYAQTLAGTVTAAHTRSCLSAFSPFLLSATQADGGLQEDEHITQDVTMYFSHAYLLGADEGIELEEGLYPIFRETDGTYTFVLQLTRNGGNAGIGGGGTAGLVDGYGVGGSARLESSLDVPVLSGSMQVWGYFFDDAGTGDPQYVSGGTLDAVTFTPEFFTYS